MEWSEAAYAAMARIVSSAIGVSFPDSRQWVAEQGMAAVWRRAGATSAAAYLAGLLDGATPADELINELVVGETYFFRGPDQFALLETAIFPELRQLVGRGLALWSAGCATGEEAYSLAIAAAGSAPSGVRDTVFATDISSRSLAAARAGVYGNWSMRGVTPETIDRIAARRDRRYVVRDRWRRSIEFAHCNLSAGDSAVFPAGTHAMDVILCRNVLIYFDPHAVCRAAALLYSALSDGGYLLTAPSDPPLWDHAPFTAVMTSAGIVYRRLEATRRRALPPGWTAIVPPPAGWIAIAPAAPPPPLSAELAPAATLPPPPRAAATAAPAPPTPRAEPAPSPLALAERAWALGDWERAADLAADLDDPAGAAIHVRAIANARGGEHAAQACAEAAARHPTSAELHHLHALLLLALDRFDDAAAAARRAVFLAPSLAAAHLAMATIAIRSGDLALARRSYRNAHRLLRELRDDAVVALADGATAGALRRAAEAALAGMDRAPRRAAHPAHARTAR